MTVEVVAAEEIVDVDVTMHEQADETRAGEPPQLEAKVGIEVDGAVVYVGQN